MTTRDAIIDAALRLASTQGIGALSVRSVAREAGVGATTLRHYFPSQPDLHHAVAAQLVGGAVDDAAIRDASRDASSRLYECLVQFLPRDDTSVATLEGWFELYRLALGPTPLAAVRELLESGHRTSAQLIEGWLTVLAEEGHVRSELVAANARYALALIDGLHLTMLLRPDDVDLAAARDTIRQLAGHLTSKQQHAPS
jgi:AcrR family transcriptional regulator